MENCLMFSCSTVTSLQMSPPSPTSIAILPIWYGFPWGSGMGQWSGRRVLGWKLVREMLGSKWALLKNPQSVCPGQARELFFSLRIPSIVTFHLQVRRRHFFQPVPIPSSGAQVQPTTVSPRSRISSWSSPLAPSTSPELPESMFVVELSHSDISHVIVDQKQG